MAAEAPTEILEPTDAAPVAAGAPPPATPADAPAPAVPKAAKEKKGKDKSGKEKKGKDKKAADAADGAGGPSVAAHPRAARGVARAKAWSGLAGFLLGGYLSLPTNTLAGAGARALLAGIICYVAAWAGAVFLWRRLVILEIKGREQQLLAAAEVASGGEASSAAGRAGSRTGR